VLASPDCGRPIATSASSNGVACPPCTRCRRQGSVRHYL